MPQNVPVLYKYVHSSLTSVLAERLVRFTPPNLLNDPYESLAVVAAVNRDSVLRKIGPRRDREAQLQRFTEYAHSDGPKRILEFVSETLGILCFTSVQDSLLMWAHYGEGHSGFLVGFDGNHPWFHQREQTNPILGEVQPIVYQSERPSVQIGSSRDLGTAGTAAHIRSLLYTKAADWSYEREWRLVRPLSAATQVRPVEGGGQLHLYEYPADAVLEVVIGAKTKEAVAEGIRRAVMGGMPSARILRARLSRSAYSLEIVDDERSE